MLVAKRSSKIIGLLLVLSLCRWASAHPMGNFSVNHYSKITLERDRIEIRYFIDLAEIPTYQELQQANISTASLDPNSAAVGSYISARGIQLEHGLSLEIDGKVIPLRPVSSKVIFPPGAGGLPTMKMGFVYETAYPRSGVENSGHATLHFADHNYPGHTGWEEIVAVASAGEFLRSSVPATDRSSELSNYPTDLLTSPPQTLEASMVAAFPPLSAAESKREPAHLVSPFTTAGSQARHIAGTSPAKMSKQSAYTQSPAVTSTARTASTSSSNLHLQANRQLTPRSRFTELIQAQHLSAWFLLTAAMIAIGLGGLHALEPGHGKTIVAAYLVGSKGTARHAVLLGLIVTASHTAGVFALGAITLYASHYIIPEQLYPWLGAFSGITIAALGCYMFVRRVSGAAADHTHAPGANHGQWMFWKRAGNEAGDGPSGRAGTLAKDVGLVQLLTLGITGGIIPCPAALIVLLSAFALHRVGLGFFLIVAFSGGLAAVLIGFGMLMVYARRLMTHLQIDGPLTRRWLPLASSAFITVLGLALTFQALSTLHLYVHTLAQNKLEPILFVTGLGLILGMRHSTDADHVVAISTVVSKQRSIRNAALIGSVWGLGHTITIFVVGSLIILFGFEIPPRLGLSMEFCVAVMLILLGVLNLTAVMQRMTRFFTPVGNPIPRTRASQSSDSNSLWIERLLDNSIGRVGLFQFLRPLIIGLVHGLAGSAAVALLVLSTIQNPLWATVYLLIFGVGTMIGMMCMTAAIAIPLTFAGNRFAKLGEYLGVASGTASVCFGSFLVWQLGFLGGLFTSHPRWTPQ